VGNGFKVSALVTHGRPKLFPRLSRGLRLVDIKEHWTREGKLYLCTTKDAFSGRIVGYSISDRMKARLAVDALNTAVARRGSFTGCVIHSDGESQFPSRKFIHALRHHGLVGSIGRVGAARDNAAMESFFSPLQKNVTNRRSWATQKQRRWAVIVWFERTYHRKGRGATPPSFDDNRIRDHDRNTGRRGRVT
jgi:putative transposase